MRLSEFRNNPGEWSQVEDCAGYLEIMYLGSGWLVRHREHVDDDEFSGPGSVGAMTFVPDSGGDVL